MIDKDSDQLKFQMSLPENKAEIFQLIWVQDIKFIHRRNDHHFYLLFRSQTGQYLQEDIPPELLSDFKVGAYYQDSKLLKEEHLPGDYYDIAVESTSTNVIRKISEVINDAEYQLTHSYFNGEYTVDFTNANKNQHCIVFEDDQSIVIFPCSLVSAIYYFTSSSMRRQIFAQNLEGLYERGSISLDSSKKEAKITLNWNAKGSDAINIVRFATNDFARSRWMLIGNAIRASFYEVRNRWGEHIDGVPLIADFPVVQLLDMTVRALEYTDSTTGKRKLLVLDILKENSAFDFNKLIIFKRHEDGERVQLPDKEIPYYKTSDYVSKKRPSSALKSIRVKKKTAVVNPNAADIDVTTVYISEDNGNPLPIADDEGPTVGVSFEEPEEDENRESRPAEVEPEESNEEESTEEFSLDDFLEMVEILTYKPGVGSLIEHDRGRILSGRLGANREYIHVTFTYQGMCVCLIEIDQKDISRATSTYVLVSSKDRGFQNHAMHIVDSYTGGTSIEQLTKEYKAQGIRFLGKKHPVSPGSHSYNNWCEDLLRMVIIKAGPL